MAVDYEFWLSNPSGELVAVLDRFRSAYIQRAVNKIGQMTLSLPWGAYPGSLFVENSMIQAWRSVDGGPVQLVGGCPFFLQRGDKGLSSQGLKTLDLTAYDPLLFLATHIVNYPAGSSYTDKSGPADNVMKAFFRENLGGLAADYTRDMEPWIVTQDDAGAAPSTSKAASRRDLLTVFQELAADSFANGTYLAFDIVSSNPTAGIGLEFRTYTGIRGNDHRWPSSPNPVILDPDNGNLTDCLRTVDNTNAANVIIAGGQGEGASRVVKTATDDVSAAQSVWNRRELWIDARNAEDGNAVQAEADAALKLNRRRITFSAKFVPTPGVQFGRDFDYGDFVTCVWDDEAYDMRADAFGLRIQDGTETPDIAFRSDE